MDAHDTLAACMARIQEAMRCEAEAAEPPGAISAEGRSRLLEALDGIEKVLGVEGARFEGGDRHYDLPAMLEGLDDWINAREGGNAPPVPPPGYVLDHRRRMVPEAMIRTADRLEDQTVRVIAAFGLELARQVQRFKTHSRADLEALCAVLAEQYTARRVTGRGNVSYRTIDGRLRVVVQSQDRLEFGPELQVARTLIEGLIERWGAGARKEVRALMAHAWPMDRPGHIHRESVLGLLRLNIDDPEWRAAQTAIRDSVRVRGTKSYLRVQYRSAPNGKWETMPINIAAEWES